MPRATTDLNIRIVKELTSPSSFQWNFRESFASIAQRIGVDAETVRVTLGRLVDSGLFQSWRLVLNPQLLGCMLGGLQFEVDDVGRKARVLGQIRLLDGVVQILDYHGATVRVVLYFEDEFSLKRKIGLIRSISGFPGKEMPHWTPDMPPCDLKLGELDWKILGGVMHDPKRETEEVARETGASTRTVNRRLRKMIREKVAYLIPVPNVRKWKGVMCGFLISCSEQGKAAVNSFLKANAVKVGFVHESMRGIFLLTVLAENLSEASDLNAQLTALNGVREVKMSPLKEFIFIDDWLDQAVARKISDLGPLSSQ